jgi:hypothetical protein
MCQTQMWVQTSLRFAYINVYQLDEEQLKEKKKQKLMKAGWEARERARKEKEREREEREAEGKREEDERNENLSKWSGRLRKEHEVSFLSVNVMKLQLTASVEPDEQD